MTDTEELIKAALAKGGKRAPHPGPILNALAEPRRRRTPRTLLAIAGVVAVVAAIALPIVFRTAGTSAPPATHHTPPSPQFLPARYTVLDIPPGFVESRRQIDIDGGRIERTWVNGEQTIQMSVHTPRSPMWTKFSQRGPRTLEIGGVIAWWMTDSDTLAEVAWMPNAETAMSVQIHGPDARTRVRSAAESVRPDSVAGVVPPLFFGPLPSRFDRVSVEVAGNSPQTGTTWLKAASSVAPNAEVWARIVARGATTLTGWNVVAPTMDGREIELAYNGDSQLTEEQARQIAEDIAVGPEPDLSWLGRR